MALNHTKFSALAVCRIIIRAINTRSNTVRRGSNVTESEMRNTKKINMDRKTLGVPVGRNIYTTESSTAAQKLRFAPDCFADCNLSVPWTGTMFFDGSASPVRNAQKKKRKINQK